MRRSPSPPPASASGTATASEEDGATRRESSGQLVRWMFYGGVGALALFILIVFYAEYSLRSDLSRSHSNLRDLSVAAASYFVDYMGYPFTHYPSGEIANSLAPPLVPVIPTATVHSSQYLGPGSRLASIGTTRPTIAVASDVVVGGSAARPEFYSLTSPIAYLSSFPRDPFSPLSIEGYTFVSDRASYTFVGYGPAHRRGGSHEFGQWVVIQQATSLSGAAGIKVFEYDTGPYPGGGWTASVPYPRSLYPAHWMHPRTGRPLAYDPTNGLLSDGDLVVVER